MLAAGLVGAAEAADAVAAAAHDHGMAGMKPGASPLVEKVRRVTARYVDINAALSDGFVQATPCVSGPNDGAMGVHFIKPERLHDGELKGDEPEMLIYEPQPGGAFRLVGVEYLVLASEWAAKHAPGVAPSVDGHLANFLGEPNRYALPSLFELHVWAWAENPNGAFSDWNSRVSCEPQVAS
jgi:hypothetical protein